MSFELPTILLTYVFVPNC